MQLTGRVHIRVDGELLATQEGSKLNNPTGTEREAVVGNKVHGYIEKTVVPGVECTLSHSRALSVTRIGAITDATLTFECDTGVVYILSHAWTASVASLEGSKLAVKFEAESCEEVS